MTTNSALDPVADFDTPVRKQQTLVPEEAMKVEAAVRKGFALSEFVRPHFERDKKDVAFIGFEISLPLTEEHEKWVPEEIGEAWEAVQEHGFKRVDVLNVDMQRVEIILTPDAALPVDKELALSFDGRIEKASVSVIEEKGTGEAREVIRLQFRATTELDNETGRFARVHFGHSVWIKLTPIQRKLIK